MKKILILSLAFTSLCANAQTPQDAVVMTVGDKQVTLGEFEFIAKKNNGVNLSDDDSLKEYVELFKNFKLKVAEAEELGLDKNEEFETELKGYKDQLKAGYLSDKDTEEAAIKVIYDRGNEYLVLSQIILPFTQPCSPKDTTVLYEQAMQIYNRIQKGEDFDQLGTRLSEITKDDNQGIVYYAEVPDFYPLEHPKQVEEIAYSMKVGEITRPFRSTIGYHLVKLKERHPHPGKRSITHLRIPLANDSIQNKENALRLANEIYRKAVAGEELVSLIKTYSFDKEQANGVLPSFGPGEVIKPIEETAFSLSEPGAVAEPFLTQYGYHIVQLLEKLERDPFDREKIKIRSVISRSDRNFELYKEFVDRLKKEFGYVFYPEAYTELELLCNDCFPGSKEFSEKAKDMDKPLIRIHNEDVPQSDFAKLMELNPASQKLYAGDFMEEVFNFFIKELTTTLEKNNIETKYPEYTYLTQEYRDGMLLFEVSNLKIWNQPIDEQPELEKQWITELSKKYPVTIDWELLKKLKNN